MTQRLIQPHKTNRGHTIGFESEELGRIEQIPERVHTISIPSAGRFSPTVIDKSQPIESIGSRLHGHTRIFNSSVRARSNYRKTLPAEGIQTTLPQTTSYDSPGCQSLVLCAK